MPVNWILIFVYGIPMIFPLSRPLRNIHLLIHLPTTVFFILSTTEELIVGGM